MFKKCRILAFIFVAAMLLPTGCSDPSGQRELRSGLRELKRGNYVRAKSLLERSIHRRPGHVDNAPTHNYLGIAAWGLKQYDEAMTAFEDSRRLNPNLVEPVYNMGLLAAERGEIKASVNYLNEAATMNKSDPRPLEFLAELYMERGQWGQARNALYTALDREPRSSRIYNAIATAFVGMGQPDQAIESLMFALEYDTKYAPAILNLAVVYDTMVGDVEQARAYYKRYIDEAPRAGNVAEVRAALTRLEQEGAAKKDFTPAVDTFPPTQISPVAPATISSPSVNTSSVVAASPTPSPVAVLPATPTSPPPVVASTPAPPAMPPAYDGLMKQAAEKVRAGQLQQAIDTFVKAAESAAAVDRIDLQEQAYSEAVRLAIDQPRAHVLLAQHYYDRGRYEQASKSFRAAAALNEEYAPAQLGLARLAVRNSEADAAVVHYRKAMAADPALADAAWEFAQLYDKQLELPENAARAYRDFANNFPSDSRRAPALTRAEELSPEPRVATPAATVSAPRGGDPRLELARKLDYRPPATRNAAAGVQAFNRAVNYQKQQDWDNAVFFFLRSLENDDSIAGTFYNLGICYTMKGQRDLAGACYQYALRLDPALRDAKYNLALLQRDTGEEAAAIASLEDIIKSDPNYAMAHYLLGSIYAGKRPHARAGEGTLSAFSASRARRPVGSRHPAMVAEQLRWIRIY